MARYRQIDTNPKFIAVDLASQLLPGTFEHALNHLCEHEVDLSGLDARYSNDETGAPAYPPAVLLKLILFAYSRGIVSSRAIERAGREHVTFIALSGDSAPHFTTIAGFIRALGDESAHLFAQVLFIGTTRNSPASRCVVARRSIPNGSFTAWCTTSRSWRTMAMRSKSVRTKGVASVIDTVRAPR